MQEDQGQPVSFQPIGMDVHYPWFVNLFVIYLFCVLLLTLVEVVTLMWTLKKLRKPQVRDVLSESGSQSFWETSYSKIRSIRNFSHLTFLLAVLVLGWNATDILAGVSMEKVSSSSYVAARFEEALIPFLTGIIVCSGLFGSAMFLESRVRKGRLMLDRKTSKLAPPAFRTLSNFRAEYGAVWVCVRLRCGTKVVTVRTSAVPATRDFSIRNQREFVLSHSCASALL